MKIKVDPSNPFNLEATLCCGQAFRWEQRAEWWYGVASGRVFKTRQTGETLEIENVNINFAKNYFGLIDELNNVLSQICKDPYIKRAVKMFSGLRILRQDPWECLISYICATYKNIAAIRHMLLNLSRRFGDKVCFDGFDFYTFPTAEDLAQASVNDLLRCGLGYRAKYVHETARTVAESPLDFARLRKKCYEEARHELVSLAGVGPKVADCILLFSLDKLQSFPVDVWVRRAVLRHYADHFSNGFIARLREKESLTSSDYEKLSLFGRTYFGEFAGYAQEYLYHYERTMG
jgi:N-glycosylase/DNA lyase